MKQLPLAMRLRERALFDSFVAGANGAAVGQLRALASGAAAGALGGVAGTLGGYEFRSRLVKATGGRDFPIALLEDAIAIGAAFWIVSR